MKIKKRVEPALFGDVPDGDEDLPGERSHPAVAAEPEVIVWTLVDDEGTEGERSGVVWGAGPTYARGVPTVWVRRDRSRRGDAEGPMVLVAVPRRRARCALGGRHAVAGARKGAGRYFDPGEAFSDAHTRAQHREAAERHERLAGRLERAERLPGGRFEPWEAFGRRALPLDHPDAIP